MTQKGIDAQMKKFAFLLAIAAVFAMSACAFAELGDNDVAKLEKSGTACGVGKISGTDPSESGGSKVDGDYTANVYYYGTISDTETAEVYVWLSTGNRTSTAKFYATTEDKPGTGDPSGTASSGWIGHFKLDDLEATTPVTYTFGKADNDSSPTDWATGVAKAKLKLTPTEVKIAEFDPITIKAGDKQDIYVDLTDADLTPTFDAAFTAGTVTPATGAPTVTPESTAPFTKITIDATSAKAGTYTVKISTGDSNSLMIEEDGGATDISVANFPRDAFEVGTLTINVVTATPPTPGPSPSPTPSPTPDPTPDPTPEQGDVGDTPIAGGDINTNADIPQEITSVEVVSTNQRPTAGGKVDDLFSFDGQESITGGMSSVISGGGNITAINIVSTIRLDIEKTSTGGSAAFPLTIRNFDRVPTTGMTFVVLVWPKNRPGANAYDQFPASVSGGVLTANITNVGDYFSENDIIIAEVAKNASGGGSSGCDAGAAALVALVGLAMLKRRAK